MTTIMWDEAYLWWLKVKDTILLIIFGPMFDKKLKFSVSNFLVKKMQQTKTRCPARIIGYLEKPNIFERISSECISEKALNFRLVFYVRSRIFFRHFNFENFLKSLLNFCCVISKSKLQPRFCLRNSRKSLPLCIEFFGWGTWKSKFTSWKILITRPRINYINPLFMIDLNIKMVTDQTDHKNRFIVFKKLFKKKGSSRWFKSNVKVD